MNLAFLRLLTWSTVAGAVGSALALAAVEPALTERQPTLVETPRQLPPPVVEHDASNDGRSQDTLVSRR